MSDPRANEIVVVGGGFTGAALACALADGKRRIHVLEARGQGHARRFAGELIHPTGVDELSHLGLLQPLRDAGGVPVEGFAVYADAGAAAVRLPFSAVAGGRGHGLGIEHERLVDVLRAQAAARPGVALERGERVVDVLRSDERVNGVRTEAGERRADLVLSAEGRHARLRAALGVTTVVELLSFTAAIKVRGAPLPHPGYGHIFLGGPGPILAYPIARDEVRVCFDVAAGVKREHLLDRLRAAYTPLLPLALRAAVEGALTEDGVQLAANHRMRAARCTRPGFALVGDAGGCSHPLTAAGMTVCLNDVRLVAEAIDHGDLEQYERRRRGFVRSRALLTRALYRVFRGDDPASRALRDGVFRYWRDGRARAASTALLTGADPTLGGFARELAHVAWCSLPGVSGRA